MCLRRSVSIREAWNARRGSDRYPDRELPIESFRATLMELLIQSSPKSFGQYLPTCPGCVRSVSFIPAGCAIISFPNSREQQFGTRARTRARVEGSFQTKNVPHIRIYQISCEINQCPIILMKQSALSRVIKSILLLTRFCQSYL